MTEKPFGGTENLEKMLGPAHPIGRVGRPEEIANLAVWLCSDDASFITGQAVRADGGYASQ